MSTKRKRVSRGIGANVGIIRAYTKAIKAISTDFRAFVINEILNFLENKHALTADSLRPLTSEERKKNKANLIGYSVSLPDLLHTRSY